MGVKIIQFTLKPHCYSLLSQQGLLQPPQCHTSRSFVYRYSLKVALDQWSEKDSIVRYEAVYQSLYE